ncbi:UNVERIFIED_CONTAM: hypothetical protein PYX00_000483 [Menopon gallinae]
MKNRRHRPLRERRPRPSARPCRSTVHTLGDLPVLRHERRSKSCEMIRSNGLICSVKLHNGIPDQIQTKKKAEPPSKSSAKTPFVPRKTWLVYSITETKVNESKSVQTTRRASSLEASPRLKAELLNLGLTFEPQYGSKLKKDAAFSVPRKSEVSANARGSVSSVTLKHIIELSRKVFGKRNGNDDEDEDDEDGSTSRISGDVKLGRQLEKLMEEKRNYLTLQKSAYISKAQKSNFITDSFNFFNTLNQEFLSGKSTNPWIEELRNAIKENKEPKMEEYINLYKKVIKSCMSTSYQNLMDKSKLELERYTDRYYDLMRCICLEKNGESPEKKQSSRKGSSSKPIDSHYELYGKERRSLKSAMDANYLSKFKTTIENSYYNNKMRESRKNQDQITVKSKEGAKKERRPSKTRGGKGETKSKPIAEEANLLKSEPEGKLLPKGRDQNGQGKVLLKISMCDDGLIIKQVKKDADKPHTSDIRLDALKSSSSRMDRIASIVPSTEEAEGEGSEKLMRVRSESSVYPKSSPDEEPDELPRENRKLTAFRKLLDNGLHYMTVGNNNGVLHEGPKTMKPRKLPLTNKERRSKSVCRREVKKASRDVDCHTWTSDEEKCRRSLSKSRKAVKDFVKGKDCPLWWHTSEENGGSLAMKPRKVMPLLVRRPDGSLQTKRFSVLSPDEGSQKCDKTVKKEKEIMRSASSEQVEESGSNLRFETPSGSLSGLNIESDSSKVLPENQQPSVASSGGLDNGKLTGSNSEERILRKTDFVDEKGEINSGKMEDSVSTIQGESENLAKSDMNAFLEAAFERDGQSLTEVLNQFMENISEAWKAAVCLKDMIQPKTSDSLSKDSSVYTAQEGRPSKTGLIDSFRNFIRIVTIIFEEGMHEEYIKRELFLLMKELVRSCIAKSESTQCVFDSLPDHRSRFADIIAEIPEEIKEMVARELVHDERRFSLNEQTFEPNGFVLAVKSAGEKLKEMYCRENMQASQSEIYYLLPKKLEDATTHKSDAITQSEKNCQTMVDEKLAGHLTGTMLTLEQQKLLNREKSLSDQSSMYFDAKDNFALWDKTQSRYRVALGETHDGIPTVLNSTDEKYFSLNSKTFGRYRDMMYDKIISFIKSENPKKFNYGMALLRKMMDKDGQSPKVVEVRYDDEKWNGLLDNLTEMCQVIEAEMKTKLEKRKSARGEGLSEKEQKLMDTCEYLRGYIHRMKALIGEVKAEDSENRVEAVALQNSRERNMERQLITAAGLGGDSEELVKPGFILENAMEFINSFGNLNFRLDNISNLLPTWLAGNETSEEEPQSPDRNEMLLQSNKIIVKTLRRKIEKRQKKLKEVIDQTKAEGRSMSSLADDKVVRKVKDLKKCYGLLEKMICDPTLLPPKYMKKRPKPQSSVMTLLDDMVEQAGAGRKLLKTSQSSISMHKNKSLSDGESAASLTWVNVKMTKLGTQRYQTETVRQQEDLQIFLPLRPRTM